MRQTPLFIAVSLLAAPLVTSAAWQTEIEPNDSSDSAQSLDGFFDTSFNPLIGDGNRVNTSEIHPHAEVSGASEENIAWAENPSPDPRDNTYDWYSFTIETPGSVGIIDIDCGWQNEQNECAGSGLSGRFDAFVHLIDTDGTTRITATSGGDDDGNAVFGYRGSVDEPCPDGSTGPYCTQDPGSNGGEGEREGSRDSFIVYTFDVPGTYFIRVGSFGGYEADGDTPIQQPPLGDYLLHVSIIVEDDDGDGVVNDFDLCPGTPPGQAVDPAGCAADDVLESVGHGIDALLDTANSRARAKLKRAQKRLDQARRSFAKGNVKDGLKRLKYTVWELRRAGWSGADTSGLISQLVDYARAKAEAAIAMSTNRRDIYRAKRQMARAERALRWRFPVWAIEYFSRAWEIASDT